MSIKDILVYVDNDDACASRVLTAAQLCSSYQAHLTGLYVKRNMSIPAYPVEYVSAAMYESVEELAQEKLAAAREVFTDVLSSVNLAGDFFATEGIVSDNFCEQSRYADLLILPQQTADTNLNLNYMIGDILLASAAGVLVLPGDKSVSLPPRQVTLAWDGGREAALALRAAMPLLSVVKKINVISVEANDAEAIDVSRHLSRHGFETETHLVASGKGGAGKALLDRSAELDSELLIMGAYGHSRFRELVLGGTTRYVLEHADIPVLFSH